MTPAWQPEWSKWAAAIVLVQVIGLIGYEVWALHSAGDSWPTITRMTMAVIKRDWWLGIVILGGLTGLVVHFAKEWFKL